MSAAVAEAEAHSLVGFGSSDARRTRCKTRPVATAAVALITQRPRTVGADTRSTRTTKVTGPALPAGPGPAVRTQRTCPGGRPADGQTARPHPSPGKKHFYYKLERVALTLG